jgi:cardiolipin synthase
MSPSKVEPSELVAIYLVSHVVVVLLAVTSLFMAFRVVESPRTPRSTLAWLVAIAFIPFIAIPLYLLLGRRKFPRLAKRPPGDGLEVVRVQDADDSSTSLARYSQATGMAPLRSGHAFELLSTGEMAYARLTQLIRCAARSVDLTMFILGNDSTGRAVVDALVESAARGVVVRVILDAVGSRRSLRRATRYLAASGSEVRAFMPIMHSPIRGRTNLRSHRKLGIFDGEYVFAGGMNVGDEYMGPTLAPDGVLRWRDVAAVVTGPAVASDAAALFESDWQFCGGTKRPVFDDRPRETAIARGPDVVQVVASGPDMPTDTMYDLLLTWIFAARTRIAIVTPYYVPDDLLQHALVLAARRGVRTEIVVPARSNHRIADMARRGLLRELSSVGAAVHHYGVGMVHAKAMIIDDVFAYVGSPNFDMRSLFLNYESALCLYSPGAIGQVRTFIDELIGQCEIGRPPDRERWIFESVARVLAPEL